MKTIVKDRAFTISAYGVRMPRIIYGTAWKEAQTADLVTRAIEQGFRGVDTAAQPKHYEEALVGVGVAKGLKTCGLARSDLYLQTKFTPVGGQDAQRAPYDPKASLAEQVAQSFQSSLRNLQTGYVDGLILHSTLPDLKQLATVWQAMEQIFDSSGAKQLGISNCYSLSYLEALYQSARVKPAVLQNRFYPETKYDRELRVFCQRHGILYQSFWTLTGNPKILAHALVESLAAKYSRTPAQVLFRYLTQEDVIPLTGTTSELHMREDLAIFDFELTDQERDAITGLL